MSTAMRRILATQELEACMQWNYDAYVECRIPVHRYLEDAGLPTGELGRLCEVGAVEGKRAPMREIYHYWAPDAPEERASLWALPEGPNGEHLAAISNRHHFSNDAALLAQQRLPLIRYAEESAKTCEVARHPNAVAPPGSGASGAQVGWVAEEKECEEQAPAQPVVAQSSWVFYEDFAKCKVDYHCVGLAECNNGPSPYVWVGQIVEVDEDNKKFTVRRKVNTVDSWKEESITGKWNPGRALEEYPHHSVMAYFPKLKSDKRLPKKIVDKIKERNIEWSK
jgi:hypothetical protein